MYAKYVYLAGQTAAQLLADLVAICTGTTNVASLSAGCDKVNTVIAAQIEPAGWTVFDAAAGTNRVCLTAPCKEEPARLKYVLFNTSGPPNFHREVYESWNAGTHAGSNMAYGSNSNGPVQFSTTLAGTIYMHVTPYHMIMYGTYSGATFQAPALLMECDTAFSWCAPGQGFTPFGFCYNNSWYPPRLVIKNGSPQVSSSQSYCNLYCSWGNVVSSDQYLTGGAPMAGGAFATPVSLIWGDTAGANSASTPVVSGFANSGVLVAMTNAALGDEMTYNGQTYVLLPISTTGQSQARYMLLKG